MNATPVNATELDLHRLDAPYAQTRVQRPEQVRRLMTSINADGQRVPLVVVNDGERFVLVDGYQAKDGTRRANGRDLTLPDGRKLFLGSSGTGASGSWAVAIPGALCGDTITFSGSMPRRLAFSL